MINLKPRSHAPQKKDFSKRSHGVKIVLFFVLFRSLFKRSPSSFAQVKISSIVTNQSQRTSTVMFAFPGKKEISTKLFCLTKLCNLSLEMFVLSNFISPQKNASFVFYLKTLSQNCSEKKDE